MIFKKKCPICSSKKRIIVWNNKIRSGNANGLKSKFTRLNEKIFQCLNCNLVYLEKFRSGLLDNSIFRKEFDGEASVKKYYQFNKPREINKIKFIKKFISFKNKKVFESNCGAAVILDHLKPFTKLTAGLDHEVYSNHVKKKHLFFSSKKDLNESKLNFDIILSLGEIEHQFNVINFLSFLKSKLSKKGIIVFRIPNYDNIYKYMIGVDFFKFDYRISHNYYFNEKSLNYLFKKCKLKIVKKIGIQEYSTNHLLTYAETGKRVKKIYKFLTKNRDLFIKKNIEKNMLSTSFIYIVKN